MEFFHLRKIYFDGKTQACMFMKGEHARV